jgi:hypothetical protein
VLLACADRWQVERSLTGFVKALVSRWPHGNRSTYDERTLADQAGDDEAVLRCHAELDHVLAGIAEAESVRSGSRVVQPEGSDLICAGCGNAAEPVYETPRLLGDSYAHCGWTGDDPAAQAERRRADAVDAAAAAVGQAVQGIGDALVILGHRGRQARDEGSALLRELRSNLAAIDGRLHRTR